jgi:hypothetical protein
MIQSYAADDPRNPSGAYRSVKAAYDMVAAVLEGGTAVRGAKELYLPKFENEAGDEYARRYRFAPWRPEFEDALRAIASKPFTKPVSLQGTVPSAIAAFAEDVDTLGNNLHTFARRAFHRGVAFGLHGILVDYPSMQLGMTRADELQSGARPYWCHVPAENLSALYLDTIDGQTVVTHARIRESVTVRDGFGEKTFDQVRVLEPGYWQLWQADDKGKMQQVAEGRLDLPQVPLALFYAGERYGGLTHPRPPLTDLADMQMELYRALSREDEVLTFAGFPMLAAIGMADGTEPLKLAIGPRRFLIAPPGSGAGTAPDWKFVQPDAANIEQIRKHIEHVTDAMRRLGLQPLLPRSGDLTATVGALEAAKAHSAVEAWANGLQDTIEQALVFTAQWLGVEPTAEVSVHTDFGVDIDGGADMAELLKARMAGEISRETYWDELLRRGKLGPQFDPKEETDRLDQEMIDQPVVPPPGAQLPPTVPANGGAPGSPMAA